MAFEIGEVTDYLTGQSINSLFIVGTNENAIINIATMLKASLVKVSMVSHKKLYKCSYEIVSPLTVVFDVLYIYIYICLFIIFN